MHFKTTKDIKVSEKIVDQIVGQDEAVDIIKKAARQRRNVLLVGEPGTGKSLLGQALAELLPKEKLVDIIAFQNPSDENVPLIKTMPRGQGSKLVTRLRLQSMASMKNQTFIMLVVVVLVSLFPYYLWRTGQISDIIYASSMITGMVFIIGFMLFINLNKRVSQTKGAVPKLLIDNSEKKVAPFLDGTGAHAGALLGDVLHDPLQSFFPGAQVIKINDSHLHHGLLQLKTDSMQTVLQPLFIKYNSSLIRKGAYEAFFTNERELFVLGEKGGNPEVVEVLSANRYFYNNELIKITTESGKSLLVTPEHKIAINKNDENGYIEASKIKENHEIVIVD